MNCIVHSIAHHTAAQTGTRVLSRALISLVIAGQTRMRVGATTLVRPGSYLAILPKGARVTFEYTDHRDQWAIMLDLPGLTQGNQADTVELIEDTGGGRVVLPTFTPIVKEHISGWEGEFLRLRDAFRSASPTNRLRVQTGVGNVFRYVIDQRPDIFPSAPAKLRRLIDEDQQSKRGIEELSQQCGYSASRLRVLFELEYGQSPQAYRNSQRMNIGMDLLRNSNLRIKEISEILGCHHVSHFCALFKSCHGMTPTAYRHRFRRLKRHPKPDLEGG